MSDAEKQKFSRERGELIAKARPNLFSLRYLEACADFAEKKYEDALARLEQLDSDYGARRNALILRGEICQRLKRWEDSESRICGGAGDRPGKPRAAPGPGPHRAGQQGL